MKYYIGIDLGGTNIVAGVVNENYEILARPTCRDRNRKSQQTWQRLQEKQQSRQV
jgi:predicted NBD/HSP70 family sugar kinase